MANTTFLPPSQQRSGRSSRRHEQSSSGGSRRATNGSNSDPGTSSSRNTNDVSPPRGGRVGIPVEGAGFESTTRSLTDPPETEEHHSRTRGHALIDGLSQRVGVGPGSRTPNPAVAVPTAGRPKANGGPTPVATHTHTAPGAGSSLGADGFRAWGEGGGSEAGGSWHSRTYPGRPRLGRALEGVISKKSFMC